MVTEVMFNRLIGAALMSRPLMITVCSRNAGRLNSDTPISLNEFLPGAGAAAGRSFAAGAFALLGTGSVAFTSVHVLGEASFRQPVALTISTFSDAGAACARARPSTKTRVVMARIITLVAAAVKGTQRLWPAAAILFLSLSGALAAHDLERTTVLLAFERDGSFVLDVANDPDWLKLRLENFPGPFPDRVVMWVDGREIRPTAVEFIPGTPAAIHRMRGRLPRDARTLRWYYGLVIDPYPLTVRRADGKMVVEEVQGDAWSRAIDLSGQFPAPILSSRTTAVLVAAILLIPLAIRIATKARKHETA